MNRKTSLLVLAAFSLVLHVSLAQAGIFRSDGCPRCQPEKKSLLARLNEMPAFRVLCPGTEKSLVDRIRFQNCAKIGCQKCESSQNWLCEPEYIRYCKEVHCQHCAPTDAANDGNETPPAPEADETADNNASQEVVVPVRIRIFDLNEVDR